MSYYSNLWRPTMVVRRGSVDSCCSRRAPISNDREVRLELERHRLHRRPSILVDTIIHADELHLAVSLRGDGVYDG